MTTGAFKPSIEQPQDAQNPLVRFRGDLKEYEVRTETSTLGQGGQFTRIFFHFINVEVLEANEPYPFPIATIPVSYSERGETRWAALAGSFRRQLPSPDIDLLVGRKQEWHFTGGQNLRQQVTDDDTGERVWKSVPANAWQLVWIEGGASANGTGGNLMDAIVDGVDGKTNEAFYQWFYGDPGLKQLGGYNDAVTAAANRQLLETLETGGKLTRDAEGVWHKVA